MIQQNKMSISYSSPCKLTIQNIELPDDYVCDLCDAYESVPESVNLRILSNRKLKHFGGKTKFCGRIQTVKCSRDNSKVKSEVSNLGLGRVLVVDGNEDTTVALLGDKIALQALENGWSGIIVLGAVRDCKSLSKMQLGVMAIGSCPLRSIRKNLGIVGEPLSFFGVTLNPEEYIYVDDTGIIVASKPLMDENKS